MNNLTLNSNISSRGASNPPNLYAVRDLRFSPQSGVQYVQAQDADEFDTASKAAVGAALLRGVQWGLEKLSKICSSKLMAGEEFASKTDVEKTANAMKSDNGLRADIHYLDRSNVSAMKQRFPELSKSLDVVAEGRNAFYTEKGAFACAPKSKPSLILHELGHATNFEKSKIMRGLQKLRPVGMVAPMAFAFLNDVMPKRTDGKKNFIERNAGTIGFCAFLPTIIEEAAASVRGIKAAKKTLGAKANLGVLKKNYALAWATYVIAGIGTGIATKLAVAKD